MQHPPNSPNQHAELAQRVAERLTAAVHDPLADYFFTHCPVAFPEGEGEELFAGVLQVIYRATLSAVAEILSDLRELDDANRDGGEE